MCAARDSDRPSRAIRDRLLNSRLLLMLLGFGVALGLWHLATAVLRLPMFDKITPPLVVFREWFNPRPAFGVSLYTPLYYQHIGYSIYRAYTAFLLAVPAVLLSLALITALGYGTVKVAIAVGIASVASLFIRRK